MEFQIDHNPEIITAVAELLNCAQPSIEYVKFAMANPVNGNASITTMEIYPVPTLDALFFIYTGGKTLQDVIAFRDKRFIRVNMNGRSGKLVDQISRYLTGHVAEVPMELDEDEDEKDRLKQKDLQIQQLRDRNRVDKNTIQSVRAQLKMLRSRNYSSEH